MMNPLLALLIGMACFAAVLFSYLGLRTLIKKESFVGLLKDFDNLFKFGAFFLLDLIFVLIICLSYSRTNPINFVWLGLGCSLVTVLVPFKSLFLKIKNKQFKEINIFKCFAFLGPVVILVLEVALFSNVSSKKDDNLINVSFDSALIVENTGKQEDDHYKYDTQRRYITFDNTQHQIKSIYMDFSTDVENAIQVDVCGSDDGSGFGFARAYKFDSRYSEFEYFDVSCCQNNNYIRIYIVIDETNIKDLTQLATVYLHKIVINQAFPYVFNAPRFAILALGYTLILLAFKKCAKMEYKEVDKIKLLKKIILIACGVGLVYIFVNSLMFSSSHYVEVSTMKETDWNLNIYHQLFLAFKNGHPYLGYEPGESLLAIENPYVPSNRDGVFYLWDHAFYNGKYYCYYGCAPVILVMFPIYFITGLKYVPSILLMEEIGTLFSLTFFLLFVLESVKLLFKKINYPTLIFVLVTAVFASLMLSNNIYKVGYYNEGIYRIPYSYGLGFLFLIFYMLLRAYKDNKHRIIDLGVLGFAVVCMMATRPTLFVVLFLTAPLFVKMLFFEKETPWKRKLIDFAPMVGVIVVGAAFICYYNYIRFDSIFEFGQTYQLTLADNTKLAYSTKGIAPTLFHFFVLPSSFNADRFPFFDYGYFDGVPAYHNYNNGAIGLLMFPVFYSFFAMPFIFEKDDDLSLKITYYLSPLALFVLAFTTYCFAGVCPRYVVELTALASAFAVVPALKLFDKLKTKNHHFAMAYLLVSCLISGFLGINLLFCGFDGWKESDQHGLLEVIRSMFNSYNI